MRERSPARRHPTKAASADQTKASGGRHEVGAAGTTLTKGPLNLMDPMEDPLEIMKRGLLSGFGDDLDKDRAERDDYQSEAGQEVKVSLNMGVVLPEMGGDELRELY